MRSSKHQDGLAWHRSSFCGTGECAEVAWRNGVVLVRDSKNPDQPPLKFTAEEWLAFKQGILNDEFDAPAEVTAAQATS